MSVIQCASLKGVLAYSKDLFCACVEMETHDTTTIGLSRSPCYSYLLPPSQLDFVFCTSLLQCDYLEVNTYSCTKHS